MSTIAAHVQYMFMRNETLGWFTLLDRVETREEQKGIKAVGSSRSRLESVAETADFPRFPERLSKEIGRVIGRRPFFARKPPR